IQGRTAGLLVATIVALGPASALANDVMSLGEALTMALEQGDQARIARLQTDRADAEFGEVRAGYLPQVGLTSEAGWSNRFDETFLTQTPDGAVKEYSLATISPDRAWLQLYVKQTLLDLRQWREIEREQLASEVAQVSETSERDDVAYRVLHRYANLIRLERKADLAEVRLQDSEWLAEQAKNLHSAGRALEVDKNLVGLHLTDAELSIRSWAAEIDTARAELWLALGEDEPLRIPIDAGSLPEIDPTSAAYGAVEAVPTSPELRILDLRRRMQEASVAAAKAGRLPTIEFVSGYSHYGPKRFDAFEDEVWVGVDINVPIFDGFRTGSEIRGAEREAQIARLRYQQTLKAKRARVRELIRRLENGESRLDLTQQRAETALEKIKLSDLNLQAERGDLRGSVDARERHTRLALEAIDSEFAQLESWALLQRELGRLTFSILGPVASGPSATTAKTP
ncbi:MAG: TolC family protein, partial [Myxococcota bacterium]